MKTIAMVVSMMGAMSSAFALTLFNDLNMAEKSITNVAGIQAPAGASLEVRSDVNMTGKRLLNVDRVQFANGQVMSNTTSTDIRFPDGYEGELKLIRLYNMNSLDYTVSVGRTLYVTSGQADGNVILYANTNNGPQQPVWYFYSYSYKTRFGTTFTSPLVFPARTVLRAHTSTYLYLTGFEVPSGADVVVLRLDNSPVYTVPSGRTLHLLTATQETSGYLQALAGDNWLNVWYFDQQNNDNVWSKQFQTPLRFSAGTQLRSSPSVPIYLTGYLR